MQANACGHHAMGKMYVLCIRIWAIAFLSHISSYEQTKLLLTVLAFAYKRLLVFYAYGPLNMARWNCIFTSLGKSYKSSSLQEELIVTLFKFPEKKWSPHHTAWDEAISVAMPLYCLVNDSLSNYQTCKKCTFDIVVFNNNAVADPGGSATGAPLNFVRLVLECLEIKLRYGVRAHLKS